MGDMTEEKKLHIVMYPWLALGHMTSFIHLANKLSSKGHKVSLLVPPKAEPKLAPLNLHPDLITFIPINLPPLEGLPNDVQTTSDTHSQEARYLLVKAMDLSRPTVDSALSLLTPRPDIVFFDYAHWIPAVAHKHGAKAVSFFNIYASYYAYASPRARGLRPGSTWPAEGLMEAPPDFPRSSSSRIRYQAYEARRNAVLSRAKLGVEGFSGWEMMYVGIDNSDALCCKGVREMEGQFGEFIQTHCRPKPVLWNGPALLENPSGSDTGLLDVELEVWLNGFRAEGSVVYCALGSECYLSKLQFQDLLLGLELTGLPFLAVLKKPRDCETLESALPEGFLERVKGQGIVHQGWVPQQVILRHPSVGCFVTHCGAGSLSEALVSQCQLVLLPQEGDQHSNARLMGSELRVGVEVERGEEDGFFTKEGIFQAVMSVMERENEVGKEIRANHDYWREFLLREGFQDSYVNDIITNLRALLE